ncbi:MAG: dockerin type I domain-containing protein, partial [Candidatus Levyibacteriota bacterium]
IHPVHTTRSATLTIFDNDGRMVQNDSGSVLYNQTAGLFIGNVAIKNLPEGTYTIEVRTSGFLPTQMQSVSLSSQTIILPTVTLLPGDLNNDGVLNILDYGNFVSCFGQKQNSLSCASKITSDMNDDGKVDGIDYNLMLRVFASQQE